MAGPQPGMGVDPSPVKTFNRDADAVGQRGHVIQWAPWAGTTVAGVNAGAWLTVATNTGDIAYRQDSPPSQPPQGAVGIKAIVAITSNTSTAYVVQFLANSDEVATSVASGGAVAWSFNVATNATVFRNTFDIPLVRGKMNWTVITSGTPRYDINFFFTGWILG